MTSVDQLRAQAKELEDEGSELEAQGRPIAAQCKLNQATDLRKQIDVKLAGLSTNNDSDRLKELEASLAQEQRKRKDRVKEMEASLARKQRKRKDDSDRLKELEASLAREQCKRKADIARLERLCRNIRHSISEARQVGAGVIKTGHKNFSYFEKLLFSAHTQPLLEAFLRTQESRQVHQLMTTSAREADVQNAFNLMLRSLCQNAASDVRFFDVKDTHDVGIPLTESKPNMTLVEDFAAKPHIASVIQLKWDFTKEDAYQEAVGQISDQGVEFDRAQPKRAFWIHAVADKFTIEFWRMALEEDDAYISSGKLRLEMDADCQGLRLLAGLLLADPQAIGYHPVELPKTTRLLNGQELRFLYQLDKIAKNPSLDPETRSIVETFKATVDGHEEVIVKLAGTAHCVEEGKKLETIAKLQDLAGRVVQLVDLVALRGSEIGLVLRPAGELVDLDKVSLNQAFNWVQQVAETVGILNSHGQIHGDISYWNVIIHEGRAILIDFCTLQTLEEAKQTASRTGTLCFMALGTILYNFQSMATELECCFYLLLYLLSRGRMPWTLNTMDANSNQATRLGWFATRQGWADILKHIDVSAHARLEVVRSMFYVTGKYNLANVKCEAFVNALKA